VIEYSHHGISQHFLLMSQGLELQHAPLASSEATLRNVAFSSACEEVRSICIFPSRCTVAKCEGITLHSCVERWDLPDVCQYLHAVSQNLSGGADCR